MTADIDSSLDNTGDISARDGTVSDVPAGIKPIPLTHSNKTTFEEYVNGLPAAERAAIRKAEAAYLESRAHELESLEATFTDDLRGLVEQPAGPVAVDDPALRAEDNWHVRSAGTHGPCRRLSADEVRALGLTPTADYDCPKE